MVGAFWEKLHCIISRSRALDITLSTSATTGNHGDFLKQLFPFQQGTKKVGTLVSETSAWYVCAHRWHRFRTLSHFIVFKAYFKVLPGVNRYFKELKIFLKLMNLEKLWVKKVISLCYFCCCSSSQKRTPQNSSCAVMSYVFLKGGGMYLFSFYSWLKCPCKTVSSLWASVPWKTLYNIELSDLKVCEFSIITSQTGASRPFPFSCTVLTLVAVRF